MTIRRPKLHLPDLRYDCLRCGKSCRTAWRILLDEGSRARVEATPLPAELRARGYTPFVRGEDGLLRLGRTAEGACLFLGEDLLCRVHAEAGVEAKPRTCRQYPFFLAETPDGVFVGLSFRCTAVQQGHGRPLEAHRAELEELARTADYRVPERLALVRGRLVDWEGYRVVEAFVERALQEGPGLGDALWRALSVAVLHALRRVEPPLEEVAPPPRAAAFEQTHAAGVVGLLEAADAAAIEPLTRAVAAGGPFPSRTFGCVVDPRAVGGAPAPAWLEKELARYVGQLMFRKFLAGPPSVVARLCLLHLAPALLRWYAGVSALRAGRTEVLPEDLHLAWDVVDGRLMSHNEGVEPLLRTLEQGALDALSSPSAPGPPHSPFQSPFSRAGVESDRGAPCPEEAET